ncbi:MULTISPECIES: LysR substrate-binding domain-containing protein [Rhizobium]|uniref:LysR substrate-binding domain-containing protein n=1 Tax=Rhizobium TaxID=379 RepID=UPI000DDD99FA|nr:MULTISPECIES: LysR substrate-binding domain-containing protein [Rhizobium]
MTHQIAAGQLVPILEAFRPPPMPVSVLYPQNRHLSSRIRVFIDWLTEVFHDP